MNEEKIIPAIEKLQQSIEQLNKELYKIKEKIISDVTEVIENTFKVTYQSIENDENKLQDEAKERQCQIDRLNNITEYDKIILKNLESRISILEEETQNYTNSSN